MLVGLVHDAAYVQLLHNRSRLPLVIVYLESSERKHFTKQECCKHDTYTHTLNTCTQILMNLDSIEQFEMHNYLPSIVLDVRTVFAICHSHYHQLNAETAKMAWHTVLSVHTTLYIYIHVTFTAIRLKMKLAKCVLPLECVCACRIGFYPCFWHQYLQRDNNNVMILCAHIYIYICCGVFRSNAKVRNRSIWSSRKSKCVCRSRIFNVYINK